MPTATGSGTKTASSKQSGNDLGWLKKVTTEVKHRPSAMILMGLPGVGKSSLAGNIPNAIVLHDPDENTWSALKSTGSVPSDLAVLPAANSYSDLTGMLDELATTNHPYGALIIDTLGGVERLAHNHTCEVDFNGDWGPKGFMNFHNGYRVCARGPIRELCNKFDRLRDEKGMTIFILAHTQVKNFKNPISDDYDRIIGSCHEKTWEVFKAWSDAVLFASYDVEVNESGKGKGGHSRTIHTAYCASFDAKNRFGLPEEISMGRSGAEAWNNLATELKKTRSK